MSKPKRLLFIGLIAAALFLPALPAQAAGGVQASLTASRSELAVGDPVELTLQVTHPAGTQVIIPKLEQSWGNFEVRQQGPAQTSTNPDGTATTRKTISVTLFRPGTFETPPLPFSVTDAGGHTTNSTAAPISLTVTPVLAPGDTSLNDIRPQADMKIPFPWPALLGGLAAAAVIAAVGWRFLRRPHRVVDHRPPYQVALDELNRIAALGLPNRGRFKEHYSRVTDVLRLYLETQFGLNATDRTTTELKQELAYTALAVDHVVRLITLFAEADLVKFANAAPNLDEAGQLLAEARQLVEQTHSQPDDTDSTTLPINTRRPAEAPR